MATDISASSASSTNRGWVVTFAGTGINLALGMLYTWSLIKGAIGKEFGWHDEQLNDPYAICCLVFAFTMILAGRLQDKFGPRVIATIGGLLVGAGLILISQTNNYAAWIVGFGVLVGIGIGFGYSSATPPALKWFPSARTGLIAGLVVAGFGLAPVYLAPTTTSLLGHYGLLKTMLILGVAFTVIICSLSQLLTNPPAGYVPAAKTSTAANPQVVNNFSPAQMLKQPEFWLLWVLYFIGSGAGLMVIGSIGGMAKKAMGDAAYVAVALMAVGNASGRIIAGFLSDKIGRRWTLMLVLGIQALLMFVAIPVTRATDGTKFAIVIVAVLIGFNYGANLSLFPSITKNFWGLKNFGMNYGVLFTAWGVGGFVLSRVQQMLTASSKGSYDSSFITAGILLLVGVALTFLIKPPKASSAS